MENDDWIKSQNNEVKRWRSMVARKLVSSASRFTNGKSEGMVLRGTKKGQPHSEAKLAQSINGRIYVASGLAEGIGFSFARHGVFVQKGVGSGYQMSNGMVLKVVKGDGKKSNSKKGGSKPRKPVDWFNGILETNVPELIERIMEINADATINSGKMLIK